MPDSKRLSIIIPSHNRCESLRRTLVSLCHQTCAAPEYECIVVDNGSTDGTAEMIRSREQPYSLTYLQTEKRRRFESGRLRNLGVAAATGEIVVFLDSDMVVTRRYCEQHREFHNRSSNVAVFGKMLYLESNDALSDGLLGTDFEARVLGKAILSGNTVHRFLAVSGNLRQYLRPWDFCVAANFSAGRDAFVRAGGFDEDLDGDSPVATDVACGLKMHAAGIALVYGRAALGFHQRNHPVAYRDAPEYFHGRRDSVWRHDQEYHKRWLPAEEQDAVMRHMLGKRRLTEAAQRIGARYTMQSEFGPLCRLLPLREHQSLPSVTVLLISDGGASELEAALRSFDAQDCDHSEFEVIVLDPRAATEHDQDNYTTFAESIVQCHSCSYLLRYFPTGAKRHRANAAASKAGDPLMALQSQRYEEQIRSLLVDKPLAPLAVTRLSTESPVAAGWVGGLLSTIACAMAEEGVAVCGA